MVISTDPLRDEAVEGPTREYPDAVVYSDREAEVVLHEGAVRLLPNGWVELPTDRLLSPGAVHHVDPS
jgi:hypothetical protein